MKKFLILVFIGILFLILGYVDTRSTSYLNFAVLTLTLVVLIWYTYDTHRIANQTIESGLRPVILRSGFIDSWDNIKFILKNGRISGKHIQFTVLKNIAKDIEGYIIINGYKYQLLFGNDISKSNDNNIWLNKQWSWMMPGNVIYAAFIEKDRHKVKSKNKIYISYKDIAGNSYCSIENEEFSQTSYKL